jgi:hypothetical protein
MLGAHTHFLCNLTRRRLDRARAAGWKDLSTFEIRVVSLLELGLGVADCVPNNTTKVYTSHACQLSTTNMNK